MSAKMRLIAEIDNDRSFGGKNLRVEQAEPGVFKVTAAFGPDGMMLVAADHLREFVEYVTDLLDLNEEEATDVDDS